ncbi:MAG: FHA domain-containing protein [Sandaracinaceae bacterium]|nr:FHA domain-containing protein [Sandaracinaceae bacterium]
MTTTVRDSAALAFEPTTMPLRWALMVVHHRSAEILGLRRVIAPGSGLELGRSCGAYGDGAFNDPSVSRSHARVEIDPRGALVVSDLGSANGTWVDGTRVAHAALRAGSVLRVGPVLLLAQHGPETYPLRRSEHCPALAWSTADFTERMRRALEARQPLAVSGARPSAWRPHLALAAEQLGLTLVEATSLVAPPHDGERLVLSPSALRTDERSALPERVRGAAALVVSADRLRPEDGWVEVALPALRERLEDLPWIVRGALHEALGEVPELDASYASRLLLSEWPEDVDGVRRWAASVAARPRQAQLVWTGEDLSFAGGPRTQASEGDTRAATRPTDGPSWKVARDGTWFATGEDEPVDLRTRFALSRILRALVSSHLSTPDATVSLDTLMAAGWPGEKLLADSGPNRVYVAIATLRRVGLRDVIERREGGYRIAVDVRTELVEAPPRRHGASA